jgi:hypothetical protein
MVLSLRSNGAIPMTKEITCFPPLLPLLDLAASNHIVAAWSAMKENQAKLNLLTLHAELTE